MRDRQSTASTDHVLIMVVVMCYADV